MTLCLSTYFVYPAVIWLIGRVRPLKTIKEEITPSVSVIIPAHNEAKSIDRKIRNTLDLDYPRDKMEILVGSDGSNDATAAIAKGFGERGVRVFDFKVNRGKTAVQNDLVAQARGEILIFTDAASFLSQGSIRKIVNNFADHRIGCVAGRLRYVNTDSNLNTQSQGLYWSYEVKVREFESELGSLIGVDGPLYAVRRGCYVPLAPNLISDLMTPLLVLEQGKKVVLEPEAVVDEEPTAKSEQEFATRKRITLRGLVGISAHLRLLNPVKNPLLSFQIFFHKAVRWFVGPLVVLNILSCIALSHHPFFKLMLVAYSCLLFGAALGWLAERWGIQAKILRIPYYFCLVNLAATMGIMSFLRKQQAVTWTPVRH